MAFYAHHRIGFHTASARNVLITRAVLLVVGLAAGYAAAASVPQPAIAFVQAFGLVHVPAALILFFKRARGEGRS